MALKPISEYFSINADYAKVEDYNIVEKGLCNLKSRGSKEFREEKRLMKWTNETETSDDFLLSVSSPDIQISDIL